MEQRTSQPASGKVKEEVSAVSLCPAKPSPSYIDLQASSPGDTPVNTQSRKLLSGVKPRSKECIGLLECMYANLQLQTQLVQQQMAILENIQASMAQVAPGRESTPSLPAVSGSLLLDQLPQFNK
ncbi:TSSK6-activating co-chaperone protein [Echinops telfairi]|uniref:TSSK6-activating co-chaperone protein n=1 Tax=Echinops telfairi TaxID=9371 RepID=A0AC55DRU0_ECHTE|nr:TSSK6-activating co-chaperone protein [Echinops telfairi]